MKVTNELIDAVGQNRVGGAFSPDLPQNRAYGSRTRLLMLNVSIS